MKIGSWLEACLESCCVELGPAGRQTEWCASSTLGIPSNLHVRFSYPMYSQQSNRRPLYSRLCLNSSGFCHCLTPEATQKTLPCFEPGYDAGVPATPFLLLQGKLERSGSMPPHSIPFFPTRCKILSNTKYAMELSESWPRIQLRPVRTPSQSLGSPASPSDPTEGEGSLCVLLARCC